MSRIKAVLDLSRARRSLPSPAQRKLIRTAAALSQSDIARAVGVTRAAVARWEAGSRSPAGEFLLAYQELLDRLGQEVGNGKDDANKTA